ncbi:hypothetical protein COU00_03620 [Candidatus Falkowbacteria bacterium CG10_big_fil_rev_8_21_14_0_10_43_11]|uniref:Glycosyltransferase RgtA/B/C/D-like domain-containing protein n=1 Tax=Candidatus Falkowbacteria bacterium CG10_big_fil_rev_8_21_14_0_10_43_11 TaxID=1974568 RepID=A0A2M6WLB2_9BACT|nr:MAG: hypothetical protein COU00_03620 [Candidatus Falkowbacteria bacterium CG10_big_fil_rev_8_21_14_0_10_43_11]
MHSIKNFFTPYNFVLTCLVIFFIALVGYGFPDSSSPWFDEGINLGIAKYWVEQGVFSLQTGPDEFVGERALLITTNYPLLFFVAVSFKIFGVGLWQAKTVMIIFLFIFAWLFWQLAKKYYGKNCALASLALLITFLPLYGNGKSVLGEVPGLVYFLGGLLMLDKKKSWQIFLAGLLLGLGAAAKSIYLLFIFSVFAGEIFIAVKNKKIDYRRIWLLAGGAALPLLIWVYTLVPDNFTSAYFQKTLDLYGNPYKTTNVIFSNLFRFVSESTPLHFALLFGTFFFAKIIKKFRSFNHVEAVLLVFIILNFIFYLKTVGWYRYLFPAHTLLFIIFPAALFKIRDEFCANSHLKKYGAAAIIVILFSAQSVNLFFNIKNPLYYNPKPREFADEANKIMPTDKDVLVLNYPEVAFMLKGERVWIYLPTSPHLTVGTDLFQKEDYPDYIISDSWSDNYYLQQNLVTANKYDLILTKGRYNLYVRK